MDQQQVGQARLQLYGRGLELGRARAAVTAAWAGQGLLVLLEGEAGIGKTRLAEEVAAWAADHAVVAWTTCSDAAASAPWLPWRRLLHQCERYAEQGQRHSPLADVLTAEPADRATVLPAELTRDRTRAFEEISRGITDLARARPILLVVDDLQALDPASVELLRFLIDDLRSSAVAILGCIRTPTASAVADLDRRGVAVLLAGLPDDDLARLVAGTAVQPVTDELMADLLARAAGNPLFATELVKLPAGVTRPPTTLRSVVRGRLASLGPEQLTMLEAASLQGVTFSLETVSRTLAVNRAHLLDLVEKTADDGVLHAVPGSLDRFAFSHPMIREVLYETMTASRCRDLHLRTAEAMEARGDADPATLGHHYLQAAELADPAITLRWLRLAADRALTLHAWEDAVDFAAKALEMARLFQTDATGEVLLTLGDARLRGGDWDGAMDAYRGAATAARRHHDARLLARAALGLGAGSSGFEVPLFDRAQVSLLREARDMLGPEEGDLRAWVLARLSVALSFQGDPEERRALTEEAIEQAKAVGSTLPLAYALAARCDLLAGPAHRNERLADATEVVATAEAAGDRELELLGRRLRVVALLEAGDLLEVDQEIGRFARTAEDLRQPLFFWYVALWRAMRQMMEGRLDEARASQATAAEIGALASSRNAQILVNAQRISLLLESGDPAAACALCEREFPPQDFPSSTAWMAGLYAAADRRVEAVALLDRLAAVRFASIPQDSEWVAALCMAADGAVAVDHRDAAAILVDLLAPFADHWAVDGIGAACLGPTSSYLAKLATLLGDLDQAGARSAQADAALRRAGLGALPTRRGRVAVGTTQRDSHDQATFKRQGEFWSLSYAGTTVRLRDAKGLHDIARLLARPHHEIHVLDLVGEGARARSAAEPAVDLHTMGHAGDVLDATATEQFRNRLLELEQEISELELLDPAGAAIARDERDSLVDALAAAYGLGGRPRHMDDPVERARSTVTQRIRATLRRIEKEHPQLGAHLRNSLRTGLFCSYQPELDVDWSL